jgi:ribosomal protein L27
MIDEYVFFQKGGEHITKGNRVVNQRGTEESIAPEGNRVKYQRGKLYHQERRKY